MRRNKTVLVAALDWGLGHASRCIPIISFLEKKGYNLILASSEKAGLLLQKQFPNLKYIELPSYQVNYAKHARTDWKIAIQAPKIIAAIKKEQFFLQSICAQYKIDAIISDNRFGLYHPSIPTAFISHQLALQTGLFQPLARLVNAFQKKYIQKFSECWVPDNEGENNLSGSLSNAHSYNIPIHYLGPLSRTFYLDEQQSYNYQFCFLLSGPEPQRSIFEEKIVTALEINSPKAIIVRGTQEKSTIHYPENCSVFDILTDQDLQKVINQTEVVVSRSGYSSIMDAANWQKKWAFSPTPHQPEQEYLAKRLKDNFGMYVFKANQISLSDIIKYSKKLELKKQKTNFEDTINQFLTKINT